MAQGEVYVDGSFKGIHSRSAMSAWAAVLLNKEGGWIWTMSGTIEEEHSTSYRAELKAVLEVLRIAVPPLTIYCDNLEVVKGRRKGKAWCTAAKKDCADVWRDIWFYLEDLGEEVKIEWVKSHTSWFDVLMKRLTPQQFKGNGLADAAAKAARQRAERMAPAAAFNGHIYRAASWLKWLLDYATEWPHKGRDEEEMGENGGGVDMKEGGHGEGVAQEGGKLKHEIWRMGARLICRRCQRSAKEGAYGKALMRNECEGSAAGRTLVELTGNRNFLWNEYASSRRSWHAKEDSR